MTMETGVRNPIQNLEDELANADTDQHDDFDSDSEIAIADQQDPEHPYPSLGTPLPPPHLTQLPSSLFRGRALDRAEQTPEADRRQDRASFT